MSRPLDPDLLFAADPLFDSGALLACSIPCLICGADAGTPCDPSPESAGLVPGFHYGRFFDARGWCIDQRVAALIAEHRLKEN